MPSMEMPLVGEKFPLVAGHCPVCDTLVEFEDNGVRVRFTPHDDPEWCRGMAQYHAKTLRRALEQANEDRALAQHREAFYRHAYTVALRELEETCVAGRAEDWRARIERQVREDAEHAKERANLAAVLAKREITNLRPR